jgi:hypothetical protein
MTTKLSVQEIQQTLDGFYGTEAYHRLTFGNTLVFTDGVKALCELCKAFWLTDAIWSHQKQALKDEMLQDFQLWTLKRVGEGAVLTCWRDTNNEAFHQDIEYTDFPLDEIKLYVERADENLWVCMLPSER